MERGVRGGWNAEICVGRSRTPMLLWSTWKGFETKKQSLDKLGDRMRTTL